jgi:CHAT domain-containing protein
MDKKGLRIRLRIDAPELQVIPWEYLYDQRQNFFLAANREILLTRYVESRAERRDMAVQALNVLIVLSNPNQNNPALLAYPELDVRYEKDLIVSALNELRDNTDIPIRYTVLEHAMIDEIRQYLNQDFHIFHFIGHSTFRDGIGQIILEDEEHEAVFTDETTFGQLFAGSAEMRLVILNSCKSAVSAGLPAISGLAYRVIEAGVPAVVAMQYAIADDTASLFAREFYRTLAAGNPVDFAMAHARSAIAQKMREGRPYEFGVPVLFMRAKDGRIV